MSAPNPIIRRDSDGRLDEFVASGAEIHLEAMDESQWWLGIRIGDCHWHINLGAVNPRAKGYATCEPDDLP